MVELCELIDEYYEKIDELYSKINGLITEMEAVIDRDEKAWEKPDYRKAMTLAFRRLENSRNHFEKMTKILRETYCKPVDPVIDEDVHYMEELGILVDEDGEDYHILELEEREGGEQ